MKVHSTTMAKRKGMAKGAADASLLNTAKMRARRQELGLTQEQAAVNAGFQGRQAWNNIESGRQATVTLATLARIAVSLNVSAKDLLKDNRPRRGPTAGGEGRARRAGRRESGA
jgi:transcriptional regulator with XRE-family HTH domain